MTAGIPWLGLVVFPDHRLVKARKVRFSTRRLRARYVDYLDGTLSFAEFDARSSWRAREDEVNA